MPATTCHGSGNDDNYVAGSDSGSGFVCVYVRLRIRILIHILSFGPSFCLHLTAPWRHLTIDEDVEDDSVLVSTPATPLHAPCVVIVLVMAKTLSVVGCSHPNPLPPAPASPPNGFATQKCLGSNCRSHVELRFTGTGGRGGLGDRASKKWAAAETCVLDLRLTGTWTSSRLASTS